MPSTLMRCAKWLVLGAALTAACPQALATSGGSLRGRVTGPERQPLANLQVCLSRTGGGATWTATTDADGTFAFAPLPRGIDYVLEIADATGRFAPAVQDRIVIGEGTHGREPFQLRYAIRTWLRLHADETVPLVDLRQVGQRTVYDHIFLEGLPLSGLPF